MQDFIIVGIIAALGVVAVIYTVRHFKGKGACCGGGGYRVKRKRLSSVKYKKTFTVGGMHCSHCKDRVEEAVNGIPAVSGRVDLKKGILTVYYAEDVDDEIIKSRIERAGYTVEEKN